ncbi:alkaline shock response membrane anchor protein AmaP [Micromonospora yasonensis]|uniref:alkaline shock response membrane anchor protein AmaP n=1 Tax=Micromonospora yasonensis TaxID=1128667 RepID=UPI00222FA888|nr:alkaline shock response membrane anchor protein AmaP [Micromonospora yasonensis]MCW3844352.1 alkaline shock response membrane anchor protein AmaP [Micromonospora yasonensis]
MIRGDRSNRTLLTILALVLFLAGIAVLLAGADLYGRDFSRRHLLDNPPARFVGAHGGWFWPVAAVAAAIVALLGLRWLAAVITTEPSQRRITISTDGAAGRTVVDAGALATAVQVEVEGCPGVDDVDTRLWGSPHTPRLALAVTADPDVDIAALRERLEALALPRIRYALGRPDLPVSLDLTYRPRRGARLS